MNDWKPGTAVFMLTSVHEPPPLLVSSTCPPLAGIPIWSKSPGLAPMPRALGRKVMPEGIPPDPTVPMVVTAGGVELKSTLLAAPAEAVKKIFPVGLALGLG